MNSMIECDVCGKIHLLAESELAFGLPDIVFSLSDEQRTSRCKISSDVVILDDNQIFLRGLLPLHVLQRNQPYNLGVWVEVSETVFDEIHRLWDDPEQHKAPPMPGLLANAVPYHPETTGLKLSIQLTDPNTRPFFYLSQAAHALFQEQTSGIDAHRAFEYSDKVSRQNWKR